MNTDPDPLTDLLESHRGLVDRILSTYERSASAREDLHQDLALALWRALPSFRGEASHRTFIARIAHNIGAGHVRRVMRGADREPLDEEHPSEMEGPDQMASEASVREALSRAIERLPLSQRQVVSLHLEDFSHAEIADALGIGEGAVTVRLHRARQSLSAWMHRS
jgi:RNA polymerase sigma-70 factor (ECF subfamily)